MPTLQPLRGTPGTGGSARGLTTRLSPKMREEAAKRLAGLTLLMAAVVVLVLVFQQLAQPQLASVFRDPVIRLTTLGVVLLALGVFALQRFKIATASAVLVLGMVFEVAVAFCISIVETAVPFVPNEPVLGISSLGPWIVLVGVIIPNRPVWTLVTALVAATTWPVAFAINTARHGFAIPPWGQLLVWPTVNYLMAILAYGIGRRTYGTARQIQMAMELGSYRLESLLGQGGMGEVWKATHQLLARPAAIKLVKPEMVSGVSARQADLFVKRFRREANVIAALQSPHTVHLFDFGFSKDGQLYYVMELLDGVSLQSLVGTFGPQPAARVVAFLRQICASLEEAHQQGLVHRDLKPSNVMTCKVALSYDFIKVLDFGLAKSVVNEEESQLTIQGVATGTPGYIAPEVALGDRAVDRRADLYALGCVAYFMLTGTLVFPDENPVSMALKHVQARPDPPSQRTELRIPADLERIVLHCLEKDPAARPATARDLDGMLGRCDVPAWTEDHAAEWWERHLPPTSSLRLFAQAGTRTPADVQKA